MGGFSIRNRQKEPKNVKNSPAAQKIGQQLVHEWVEEEKNQYKDILFAKKVRTWVGLRWTGWYLGGWVSVS